MNTELKDNDSSDSDCFIVNEIKPVKRPLVQKALVVKKTSNGSGILRLNKSNKNKVRKASTHSEDIKSVKKQAKVGSISSKKKLPRCTNVKSNTGSLSNSENARSWDLTNNTPRVFSSQNAGTPKVASPSKTEHQSSKNVEKIQLSPGISRKRKRFKINEYSLESGSVRKNVRKPLIKMFDTVEEGMKSGIIKESSSEIISDATFSDSDKIRNNSKLLSFLVKEMIVDVKKKYDSLFLESEMEILEKFFNLQESACKLFVRMLGRKKSWHRVCDIVYNDISNNLVNEFETLYKENYVSVNIEDQDLKIQMDLLKKPEVVGLCKTFNVSFKFMDSSKKEVLIHSLIQDCQKQKSALDMFKGKNSTTRLDKLKSEVSKYLGMCIRLNNTTFLVFYKVLLLASFPHYFGEEDQRFTSELLTRSQVYKNQVKFPVYTISSVVLFHSPDDFEEYRKAVLLYDSFEVAITNKNYEEFVSVYFEAKEQFKRLLENNEYQEHFLSLKPFLRKFSAGTVYARILTKYCTTFKRKVENSEVRNTAELLLNQNLFLTRKKGEWYEILSKALKNEKQSNPAAEVIIKGLTDPGISEVQKLALQLRGRLILKAQTCAVTDASLRSALSELCASAVEDPANIEIKGEALGENESGHRCVYIEESETGKRYMTVEERAISYYKLNGFPKGYHTEGLIIQSIYFLLFFDIIYGLSPEGVFLSPYQEAPLDFNSSSFYDSRKEEIDILLSDMSDWDDEDVEAKIKDAYYRHCGTICLIKWSDELTAELFCEVAKCITVPILVLIFQRLVRNFRQVRAGFPDLTLWNPETGKCKFVEVKSPSDRLSPGQRVWLDYLKNIGLDCEVCNVKNVSGKSFE